jgi:hypothetical protein
MSDETDWSDLELVLRKAAHFASTLNLDAINEKICGLLDDVEQERKRVFVR